MHVISRKKLLEASGQHPSLAGPLDAWYRIAKQAHWRSLADVRRTLPTADAVGQFTIFNVKGNHFRLVTEINYLAGRIFVRYVLTHADYDKGDWKR